MGHFKNVRQNLHAQRRVYLADTAADYHHGYLDNVLYGIDDSRLVYPQ